MLASNLASSFGKLNMPRERTARITAHQPSAKLSKRQFAVQENTGVEAVEIGVASAEVSGQDILDSLNTIPESVNKKEKQQLKHKAFMDRIKACTTPYSKVQRRRFNRKKREQLGDGLGSIEAAIAVLDEKETTPALNGVEPSDGVAERWSQRKAIAGRIGEGKSNPLTKAQRRQALAMERFRHPLILASSQYAVNPFQTIRTHARNTLEGHIPPV